MQQTKHLAAGSAIAIATSLVASALVTQANAATTGWNQTATGTYSYLDPANWVDTDGNPGATAGDITDNFDSTLALTDNGTTGDQVLTFDADRTTPGAMSFAYTDANTTSVPYNFTLKSDGTADRTLTLGGTLTFSPVRNRLLTIGSATANQALNVNLGSTARTISVNTAIGTLTGSSAADPGTGVTLNNVVSSGTLTKTGSGWLRFRGANANTFANNGATPALTVSAGVVSLGKTAGVNAVGGDILINGGNLFLATDNQIADTASVTLQSGAMYWAATGGSTSGNTPKADTFTNLTISGGTFNNSPKGAGSGASATDAITGTMAVSGGSISIRNGATFTANRLEVTTATVGVSTLTSSSQRTTTLTIGAGGLEITNIASGAYTPINIGNWAKFALAGNLVFNGNTNTNTATIVAATNLAGGGADTRTFSLAGGTRTFTIGDGSAAVDLLVDPDFTIIDGTGTGGITKAGAGTLQIDSTGTYTGATTVSDGRLLINGTIASAATVNGGTLLGTGTISGGITLNTGGTLAPGASIESLASGNNVWNGGSNFELELSTDGATGAAGTEWDLLAVTGTLDLTGASSASKVNLKLFTMTDASTAGLLGAWDGTQSHTWAGFVTTTGGLTAFASDKFALDTAGFQNSFTGTFSVVANGNNLDLVYAVPEPASLSLLALGGVFLGRRRR